MALLEVQGVTKRFHGLTALNDISFKVSKGEIRGLIGPNGAGKSTLFKNIAGFYKPTQGQIRFDGQGIAGHKPCAIAALGIVRTFQETTLFKEMTAHENVLMGCHLQARSGLLAAVLRTDRDRQRRATERSHEILEFVGLANRSDELASSLPLGSQKALALAIALAAEPKVLLLDEPFAGVGTDEMRHVMALTRKIRDSGVTIVLVEHDMQAIMGLCDYLTVLNFGNLLAEGTPAEIRANDKVIEAYLGAA